MRAVIQLANKADVRVDDNIVGEIGRGYLIFLAVHNDDTEDKLQKMADKISNLRIFPDREGKMNLNLTEAGGEMLLVSQFTLYADVQKGNRPSFSLAAAPAKAEEYYEKLGSLLKEKGFTVRTGKFGAHMLVSLVNDGPCTIIIDL